MLFENSAEIRELHNESICLLRHIIKPTERFSGGVRLSSLKRRQVTPMKTILLRLSSVTLFLLLAAPVFGTGEQSQAPTRFTARIGGFLGASYSVELHDGVLLYTSSERGQRNQKKEKVTPTAAEWRDFRQTLEDLKVWQWRADYPSQGVVDGTQWMLDIAYAGHSLTAHGSNNYPDAAGKPNGSPDSTETFNRYLAAIRKLTGGKSFD